MDCRPEVFICFRPVIFYYFIMLKIYKASAGSGKTFALTLEYFRIIFANPVEYKNILAVTFTNKATEEMTSRIINELHKLAEGKQSDYGEVLQKELNFSADQLKNRAKLLRTMLLHDYGRLSVTTIDRFFQRLVKAFTKELGIFPGYNVELDSDFVLLKAIDKVMQQVKNDARLRNWIGELMSSSVEEGKSWSVKAKIADLGAELFRENYMLFDKKILEKFNDKNFLKEYQGFLHHVISDYEQKAVATGARAVCLIKESGLELPDFKGNKSGCAAYFYKLAAENFEAPTATARKGIDSPESWMTKTSENRSRIEALFPELNVLLKEAVGLFDAHSGYYNSAMQLSDNLYQLGILNDLYKEIREYCNEKGLMLLSDTTRLLNALIDGNDTPFLFEKVGNYYKHLMIDEFQDTSSMQWKNFKPLVVNSLSEGNQVMIVGDVKQSIYRWRNGDWGLLAHGVQQGLNSFDTQEIVLENNWRSGRQIVEFNNVFFKKGAVFLTALFEKDAGESNPWSHAIADAYDNLSQFPQQKASGYVDVRFGPEKKEENSDAAIMEGVVTVILDIMARGGSLKDIVILVRGGKEGAFVANYLMEYNKTADNILNFISNDSLYVWSSPYVKFIVAVLKYITEPYDMVNRAVILYYYRSFVKPDKETDLHLLFRAIGEKDLFQVLEADFNADSEKLMTYSLFETIETVIDKFSLKDNREDIPYLVAFQDIIFEYETANSNSVTLFLEWWEKEQGKKVLSTSENADAVRILTIHKSKGLEFKYVILPFCSWELDSFRPVRCIWCSNNEPGFNQLEYAPLNYSSKLSETIFKEDYYDEHLKAYVDNLNLLYVALTRAKTELYIRPYTPKVNKDGSVALSDIGAFIYYVFLTLKNNPETSLIPDENLNLFLGQKHLNVDKMPDTNKSLELKQYPVYELENRVSVKYRFQDYTDLENAGLSAINEGKLLHEIFKSIEYAGDVEKAVLQAYLSGLIDEKEREGYCRKIVDYISDPEVADWFNPDYKVINEREILFPSGAKARPDRILMQNDRVIVIDYKFGQGEEKKYLNQVQFYCNTLKKMGYAEVEGHIWYVRLGKIKSVR